MSRNQFQRQILWLRKHFDLISLEEAQRRIQSGWNDRPSVCITFDDGYADNCLYALPLLIKHKIPVTYFVTTQHTLQSTPFPHDLDRGVPLEPNNLDTLRSLAASGVEIGAHTRTHADLGSVSDPELLFDEVVQATRDLQQAVGRPIRYFAFPYGLLQHLNAEAFRLAQEHGIQAVCSAYGGYNSIGGDSFHLRRIHADPELIRVKNWLWMDPRAFFKPRFTYETVRPKTEVLRPDSGATPTQPVATH